MKTSSATISLMTVESSSTDAAAAPTESGQGLTFRSPESAFRDVASHVRLWLVAVVGLALDLWSKHWAFTQLDSNPMADDAYVAIPYLMTFRRSLNPGALFGLGKGLTPLFIGASVLALAFVLFLFIHSGRQRRSLHVALALVLAGALGNLYDRAFMIADVVKYTEDGRRVTLPGLIVSDEDQFPIRVATWPDGKYVVKTVPQDAQPEVQRRGVVRDFVKMEPHLRIKGYRIDLWPWVFNVADVLLVVGVGILMLNFWWERRAERAARAQSEPIEAPAG